MCGFKTFRVPLQGKNGQRMVLNRFYDAIRCPLDGFQRCAETVHSLMMSAVYEAVFAA